MIINKTANGTELVITLIGRLDTIAASQLEEVIKGTTSSLTKLTFDIPELVYMSSAGLRVLLSTQKEMGTHGKMVIRNVGEIVMEVFEVAGFVGILNFEE